MVSDHKDLISKQLRSYLRDVNDHELVVKDQVSSFDERLTSLIDASVADLPAVTVSAGQRGLSASLAPRDLAELTGAEFAPISAP